jgi:hypothetical protein
MGQRPHNSQPTRLSRGFVERVRTAIDTGSTSEERDDRQHPERPAIRRPVQDEVVAAEILSPDAFHPFTVHPPAFSPQKRLSLRLLYRSVTAEGRTLLPAEDQNRDHRGD